MSKEINGNSDHEKAGWTDVTQAICAILSTVIIGSASLFIGYKANLYSAYQTELSKLLINPYFVLEVLEEQEQDEYIVHNEGGYIENVTVTFSRVIQLNNLKTNKTVYIPYRVNENMFYSIKDYSFNIWLSECSFWHY